MGIDIEILVMGILAGSSVAFLALALARTGQQARLARRLNSLAGGRRPERADPIRAGVTGLEGVLLFGRADRDEAQANLQRAGYDAVSAPAMFGLCRLVAAVSLAVLMALLAWQMQWTGKVIKVLPFVGFVVGFVGAKMVLGMMVSARLRQLRRELPFMLDLLLLMLESGVGLDQCFRQLAPLASGGMRVIRQVNLQLVDDLQNGMSYEAALDRWADRLMLPGAKELASLFRQSLLNGTELGPAMHVFIQEFSHRRISAARDAIGRKTAQMTIVMILFLMPALFIVLAGPAVVAITSALKGIAP